MLRESEPHFEGINESSNKTAEMAVREAAKIKPENNGKEIKPVEIIDDNIIQEKNPDKSAPEAETEKESAPTENEGELESAEETENQHQQHEKEMDEKTQEAKEEVEARFKEALAQLYARICVAEAHNGKPLPKDKITEAINNTEVLSEMWPLPKKWLANELEGILKDINEMKENEKLKPEEAREIFVGSAMETKTLQLIMNLAAMKEGGDEWLYEKQAQMLEAQQPIETASPETPISPATPAGISHGEKTSNPPRAAA